MKKDAWADFKKGFLENNKTENYEKLVKHMLRSFEFLILC